MKKCLKKEWTNNVVTKRTNYNYAKLIIVHGAFSERCPIYSGRIIDCIVPWKKG